MSGKLKTVFDAMSVWLADVDDPETMMEDWEEKLPFDEQREHFMDRAYDIMLRCIQLKNDDVPLKPDPYGDTSETLQNTKQKNPRRYDMTKISAKLAKLVPGVMVHTIFYSYVDEDGNNRFFKTNENFDHSWLCEGIDNEDLDEIEDVEIKYREIKTGDEHHYID